MRTSATEAPHRDGPTPRAGGRPPPGRAPEAGGYLPNLAIGDYGLIGNLHTAALVSRTAGIDWACFPRFASPSAFARLVDPRRGGTFAIHPTEATWSSQAYVRSTAILRTTFHLTRRRRLRVTDFMPILEYDAGENSPMVVRAVEAIGAPVRVEARLDPRFGYGRYSPTWRRSGGAWRAESPVGALTWRSAWPVERTEEGLVGVHSLAPGEPVVFELWWGRSRPTEDSPLDLLHKTEGFWDAWVHHPGNRLRVITRSWEQWVERSEITLKLLSHAGSSAFIAAPTTSLPEWIGGTRNWDYRYVWVRDAAGAAQSLLLMGHIEEARTFLGWLLHRLRGRAAWEPLRVVYAAHGDVDLEERELEHLSGFLGSRPVRVGNEAAGQAQLDIYGELLDAARLMHEIRPEGISEWWPELVRLGEEVSETWRRPDQGIWEMRTPPAHFVHSKAMAWVALDLLSRLAGEYGTRSQRDAWEREATRVRSAVLEHGYDAKRRTFVQAFDVPRLDAATLRLPMVGFLPPDDPRVEGTVRAIEADLTSGPYVYRYRAPDGIPGPEGAFLPCSFWLVECLARSGEVVRARRNFEGLLAAASPTGLFPEEFDPEGGVRLGNYPQALTHIAVLRAALALGSNDPPSRGAAYRLLGLYEARRAPHSGGRRPD